MKFSKLLLTITYFTLVLCDNSLSQSTFFLDEGAEAVLISEYPFLHGFGVHFYSDIKPDSSYKRACEKALDDLSTNLFISVYVEEFRSASHSEYSFPELSVKDSTLFYEDNIVKVDSFQAGGNAYCVASFNDTKDQNISVAIPPVEELAMSPVKFKDTWFALGTEKIPRYNSHISWMKAKNNALIGLSRVLKTLIQSSQISLDDRASEFTYFKSNMIFEDIVVARRYVSQDHLIVVVAIAEDKVYEY